MTSIVDWRGRVGESWAAEWQRTDRSFGVLTDMLLGKASALPFRKALDVGCGGGELSLSLGRGHPMAEIRGIDVSEPLIDIARRRGSHLTNVSFAVDDASRWSDTAFRPDLILSRHGVMFFDDPLAAFTHLNRTVTPDGRLVFSCFRSMAENPWAERVESFLPPGTTVPPDRFTPGPFSFAEQPHVEGILREAGWVDIAFEPVDYAYVAGAGQDPVDDAVSLFTSIGPVARAVSMLEQEERTRFLGRLGRFLANNVSDNIIALSAGAWIVSARARV